jgi:hypothetical protein
LRTASGSLQGCPNLRQASHLYNKTIRLRIPTATVKPLNPAYLLESPTLAARLPSIAAREVKNTMPHQQNLKIVKKLPICRYCLAEAAYERKTASGSWSGLCSSDFQRQGRPAEYRKLVTFGSAGTQAAA